MRDGCEEEDVSQAAGCWLLVAGGRVGGMSETGSVECRLSSAGGALVCLLTYLTLVSVGLSLAVSG